MKKRFTVTDQKFHTILDSLEFKKASEIHRFFHKINGVDHWTVILNDYIYTENRNAIIEIISFDD